MRVSLDHFLQQRCHSCDFTNSRPLVVFICILVYVVGFLKKDNDNGHEIEFVYIQHVKLIVATVFKAYTINIPIRRYRSALGKI
jgi:hypothetical protein